jgi:hypothetical protein
LENAEKVVNPPRKPVTKNNCQLRLTLPFSLNPNTSPIRKHPIILTVKVPNGNGKWILLKTNWETRYRNTPPIKLPVPMISNIFISIFKENDFK